MSDQSSQFPQAPKPVLTGAVSSMPVWNLAQVAELLASSWEEHSITFTLEQKDIQAGQRYLMRPSRPAFGPAQIGIGVVLGVIIAAVILSAHSTMKEKLVTIFLSVLLPFGILCVFLFLFVLFTLRRTSKNIPGLFDERHIGIGPACLLSRDTTGEAKYLWDTFKKIGETSEHIFFILKNSAAVVIPKRAFTSEQEAVAFIAAANEYWQRR